MLVDPARRRAMRKCDIGKYVDGATCDETFVPAHDRQDVCSIHTIAKQEAQQRQRNAKARRRRLAAILDGI